MTVVRAGTVGAWPIQLCRSGGFDLARRRTDEGKEQRHGVTALPMYLVAQAEPADVGVGHYRCYPSRKRVIALSMRRWCVSSFLAASSLSAWYRWRLFERFAKKAAACSSAARGAEL